MQSITLAGNLGADPEARVTPNGNKVTSFRMATRSRKGGEDISLWWRVTVWGDQFDRMMQYLKKGSAVIVIGDFMPPNRYQDRNGEIQYGLEVTARNIMFSPFGRPDAQEGGFGQQQQQAQPTQQQPMGMSQGGGFGDAPMGGGNDFASMGSTQMGTGSSDNVTEDDLPF